MAIQISDAVLQLVQENPHWSNDQIADEIQRTIPGATTSAASVSSIKSKAKKNGDYTPQPSAGFNRFAADEALLNLPAETAEERATRIATRYRTLERMAVRVSEGHIPALIVSGPPGLGKSFTVEETLKNTEGMIDAATLNPDEVSEHAEMQTPMFDIVCGTITAPGLYISLWNMRNGGVLVLDDCDSAFRDETCLNILKAVLDSSAIRRVSYRKRAAWLDELGIPNSFEFKGSVVFCTNVDFEGAIIKGNAMGEHFQALIDRCLYLSLTMRTTDDFITRIRQVAIEEKLLEKQGLTEDQAHEVMDFILSNKDRFYGLSLRLVLQVASCLKADPINWQDDVTATKMRTF